nr:neuromedin-U receptor 2-like [Cherax quadricarinatus]
MTIWSCATIPPTVFSPSFHGHSDAECEGKYVIPFNTTLYLCNYIYSVIYGGEADYVEYTIDIENQTIVINLYYDDDYINFCLPMFIKFETCTNEKYFTLCHEENISFAFFHSKQCPLASVLQYDYWVIVMDNFMIGKTECVRQICYGIYTFFDDEIAGLGFRVTNFLELINGTTCIDENNRLLFFENETSYITQNVHWPCCYPIYTVAWFGNPEEHGLNRAWSYLPLSCQVGEVVLMVMVVCVAVSGVTGNLMVVVVMVSGPHRGEESNMLRTSLAVSDLLVALFVVVPSFCYHVKPFFNPNYYFDGDNYGVHYLVNHTLSTIIVIEEGFILFHALLFSQCSIVSFLTLFLLSLERLVITSRAIRYNDYFTGRRVKAAITLTWVIGFLDTLIFSYDKDGTFIANWSSYKKLPLILSYAFPDNVFYRILHYSQLFLFSVVSLCTVVFSILAIVNFLKEQAREAAEWHSVNMGYHGPRKKENRRCLVTQILMTVCFLISVVPLHIDMYTLGLAMAPPDISHYELRSYICWWLFVCATAWNPWIYNVRGEKFKKDAIIVFKKCLPSALVMRLLPEDHHSQREMTRCDAYSTARRRKMLLTLRLETQD